MRKSNYQAIDPSLISSPALSRAGRTGAARFAELPPEQTFAVLSGRIVAIVANETRMPLNVRTATAGGRMVLPEADLTQDLHHTGILDGNDALKLSSLKAVYEAGFSVVDSAISI